MDTETDLLDPATLADPCRGCGACCRTLRVSFHWLETQVPAEMTTRIGPHLVCMKGTERGDGPCIALSGDRCTIYADRPSPCRDFPAVIDGRRNPKCLDLRARLGIGGTAIEPDVRDPASRSAGDVGSARLRRGDRPRPPSLD